MIEGGRSIEGAQYKGQEDNARHSLQSESEGRGVSNDVRGILIKLFAVCIACLRSHFKRD